ncbi:hypothetical protein ESA94_09100 [Lacibacter luteus]|uniref:DUF1990 family protein n=1 Tax=Lacibacter luteus TaxID=2508719 RepID=A0A4Q1CIZ5_9BACT|nr:hypothetical protein [Lacibacter luteus]RXK60610.1 hypothetical protein ESA94_09100 [Lacibacter luteus]
MQQTISEVNFNRISNEQVVSFIHDNELYKLNDFAALESFCPKTNCTKQFYQHHKTFFIEERLEKVWNAYKSIHPKKAWCGSMLEFGLQYCRNNNKLSYIDDEYTGAKAGQIVLIRVKALGGLAKVAVGHEITSINDEQHTLETSYLVKGKSLGSQRIQLSTCNKGFTKISHHTIYKSGSWLRDKLIYPFFHTKAIREFHSNIRKSLAKQ